MIYFSNKSEKRNVIKGFAYLSYTKDVWVSRSKTMSIIKETTLIAKEFQNENGEKCSASKATVLICSSDDNTSDILFPSEIKNLKLKIGDKIKKKVVICKPFDFGKRPRFKISKEVVKEEKEKRKEFEEWFKSNFETNKEDFNLFSLGNGEISYNNLLVEISWETWKYKKIN